MGWLSPLAFGAAALLLQSCVLVSMAGLTCMAGFYDRMDRQPSRTALGCAVRCAIGGLGSLAAALVLGAMLITHFGGWWNPSGDTAAPALLVFLIGSAAWFASRPESGRSANWPCPAVLLLAFPAAVAALVASGSIGTASPQCAFAFAAMSILGWIAWRLAWIDAPALLKSARQER